MDEGKRELVKVARREGTAFDCAPWVHKAKELPKEEFKREVERYLTGKETEPWEIIYFKLYKSQLTGRRASARNRGSDARQRQVSGLLPGNDLRRFSRGRCIGERVSRARSRVLGIQRDYSTAASEQPAAEERVTT